jgi:hypothetical protein
MRRWTREHGPAVARSRDGSRGNSIVNVVPPSALELTRASPPCARAIALTIKRPKPTLRRASCPHPTITWLER